MSRTDTRAEYEARTRARQDRPARVYIAGPLSRGDQQANVHVACKVWAVLWRRGFVPMCPHWAAMQQLAAPVRAALDDWLAFDFQWLACCDALIRIPGESIGADREVAFARTLGIPVVQDVPELIALAGERGWPIT